MKDKHAIKDRLKAAKTPQEVKGLLSEGGFLHGASERTKNAWRRIAAQKFKQFAKESL